MIAQLVVGCASLVASIGLLKRWRWARRAILAFASMGLASNVYILRPSVPILVLLGGRRCVPYRATYQKPALPAWAAQVFYTDALEGKP